MQHVPGPNVAQQRRRTWRRCRRFTAFLCFLGSAYGFSVFGSTASQLSAYFWTLARAARSRCTCAQRPMH